MRLRNFGVVILTVIFVSSFSTTAIAKPGVTGRDISSVSLAEGPLQETYAYELYQLQYPNEQAKIRYLINLVRFSDCYFVRNNEVHSASIGSRWLEYKLGKYASDAKTAKSFVDKVASYSRTSGKPYYILFPDNTRYKAKVVLRKELSRLMAYEKGVERETKEFIKKATKEFVKKTAKEFVKEFNDRQLTPLDVAAFRLKKGKGVHVGYIEDHLFYISKRGKIKHIPLADADPLKLAKRVQLGIVPGQGVVSLASVDGVAAPVVVTPEPILK